MKITTTLTLSITLLASVVSSQTACNGYPELCDKLYSNIAYATTHNSYSFDSKNIASNQNYDILTQLKDGIRGFMLDAHYPDNNTNEVHLCHNSCNLLDDGPAVNTLSQFVTWLNNNPNEVITIFWENADKVPPATYNQIYTQSGLAKFAHVQDPGNNDWPSLTNMIQSGKRVVNFVDTGADQTAVPWLMPEYNYVFETPYQNTDINSFVCTVDRPKNQIRPMYVLNHFTYRSIGDNIEVPESETANVTNSANLVSHAKQCQTTFGKIPNFVAVDFYDEGINNQNVLSEVATLNGVQYVPKQLGDGTNKTSSTTGSSSVSSAAQPNNNLRHNNILIGLAGFGTLAVIVL